MNASKIVVPSEVAEAIRHYVNLADTKSEAFTDILSMGFEGERSEVILRHFDGNHDELMEALICGYDVAEEMPEMKIREFFRSVSDVTHDEYTQGAMDGIKDTLNLLGVKIDGVNA
jgi:DNA integrity scanning protein DisA with diadenylate cyclase activity